MNQLPHLLSFLCFSLLKFGWCSDNSYCDSQDACYNTTVDDENVYCRGYKACAQSQVKADEYAVLTGELAGWKSNITTDYNAYCYGVLGCYKSTLNVDNDLYVYGYASAAKATISLDDDMYVRGAYSIYDATIDGEDDTQILGYAAGMYATLEDFEKIYNYGFLSLYYADVYTGGDNKTFKMYSYGYYAGYGTNVYCEHGDTCDIACDSTGCEGLTIYYTDNSTVSVTCDSSCASCPRERAYSSMTELQQSDEYIKREMKRNKMKEFTDKHLKINEKFGESIQDEESRRQRRENKKLGQKVLEYEHIDVEYLFKNKEYTLAVINDIGNPSVNSSQHWKHMLYMFSKSLGVTFVAGLIALLCILQIKKCWSHKEYDSGFQYQQIN